MHEEPHLLLDEAPLVWYTPDDLDSNADYAPKEFGLMYLPLNQIDSNDDYHHTPDVRLVFGQRAYKSVRHGDSN